MAGSLSDAIGMVRAAEASLRSRGHVPAEGLDRESACRAVAPEGDASLSALDRAREIRWSHVVRYLPIARRAGARWARRSAGRLQVEDCVQVAIEGLYRATARYDPTAPRPGGRPGVTPFATYAHWWVRASLMRSAVETDGYTVPSHARASLAARRSGAPGRLTEAAHLAALGARQVHDRWTDDDSYRCAHEEVGGETEHPEQAIDHDRALRSLRRAVARLPEHDRSLLESVYVDGHTLREAGSDRGYSRARAVYVAARALDTLRRRMGVAP